MTTEELKGMIESNIKAQLDSRNIEITDQIKGEVDEAVQESMKNIGPGKETPFDDGGREDPKGGFVNFADFAGEVYRSGDGMTRPSKRLQAWNDKAISIAKAVGSPAQSVGSLEGGGALIPPEFSTMALSRAQERSSIMSKAMVVPMQSNVIEIPYIVDFDSSQGKSSGNVKFRWVAETEQGTGNDVELKMVQLTLREANAMIYISKRLMDFSPVSVQPFLTRAVDSALDLALSNAWVNGTGAGQPLGILNADALVTITKEVDQAADSVVYENTLNMLARFYGNTGAWYANRTIIPQLGLMNVTVGSGGSAVYIAGNGGVPSATGPFPSGLHGAPMYYEQCMPILGDVGDLVFADWSQYLIGQFTGQRGLLMTDSAHLKFDFRQHAFQFTFYTDGQPWWPKAYTPLKGDTQSPFVCIAAR